jgi:hypothetical protein
VIAIARYAKQLLRPMHCLGRTRSASTCQARETHTIQLTSSLPIVTDAVTIDGYTQSGATPNTNSPSAGTNAALKIVLDGANTAEWGLRIAAGNSVISGLVIHRSLVGIRLEGGGANQIEGNFIGTDVTGATSRPNGRAGIVVDGSSNNVIGATTPASRNLISGNSENGVLLDGDGISGTGNVVRGNLIGTTADGISKLGNSGGGVTVGVSSGNTIGGTDAAARNIISGNQTGVYLCCVYSNDNIVQGNYIGTDVSGTLKLENSLAGVTIAGSRNRIGGPGIGARNVISGNGYGVGVDGTGNIVQGNLIGTDVTGGAVIGNASHGVAVGDPGNTIGGSSQSEGNVISGNYVGVGLSGDCHSPHNNLVQGNLIGTDGTGLVRLGNHFGVELRCTSSDTIGGLVPGARNVISGNDIGIKIASESTANNVQGNLIGLGVDGRTAVGNISGIEFDMAYGNTIGGTATGAGNKIAFNFRDGVSVFDVWSVRNGIRGNSIYSNGELGINLWFAGALANDTGDSDAGANDLQNFPILTSVSQTGGLTAIAGTLNGAANANFHIDLYYSRGCDPTGHGEGEMYIGSIQATTNNNGDASFNSSFPMAIPPGTVVTATATDASDNTSEFSRWREVPGGHRECDGDGVYDSAEGQCGDVIDDDGNGLVNDGCPQLGANGETGAQCTDAFDNDFDGWVNDGCQGLNESLACGSDALDLGSRPERTDLIFTDDDGDGLVNEPLPAGTEAYDCDGDKSSGALERYVFSAANTANDQKKCGVDAWPADINNSGFADVSDVTLLAGRFGESIPPAPVRYDIAPEPPKPPGKRFIDISDIARVTDVFGQGCG